MDVMGDYASNDPEVFLDNLQSNSQQENLQDVAEEEGTGHIKTSAWRNNRPQRTRNTSIRKKVNDSEEHLQTVFKISSMVLTTAQSQLLSRGLSFCPGNRTN